MNVVRHDAQKKGSTWCPVGRKGSKWGEVVYPVDKRGKPMFARIVYGLCVFCVLSSLVPLLAGSAVAATVLGNEVKRKASDPGEGDF